MVKYVYDAWGNHAVVDNNGNDVTSGIGVLNPFRYRGYYYDTETELYYLQTRYYDPEVGRFISQDSLEYADPETINGLNLYAYCGDNPVMNIDPTGTILLSITESIKYNERENYMNLLASEVIAKRVFSHLYIYLDIVFLVALLALLIFKKRYLTVIFGVFGGILYMIVDYGIFHLATGSRHIEGGNLFWVLLWMSMSYGITNFVLIWTWIAKDKRTVEFTLFILVWWIVAPMLAQSFGSSLPTVTIWRETGSYHGYMALILLVGYVGAIIYNLLQKDKTKRFPLLRLLIIGIAVQFCWEFSLLLGGIRSDGFGWEQKLQTIAVNSLLETNLGAVPIYCIYILITQHFTENLKKRADKVSFTERIAELNAMRLREPK